MSKKVKITERGWAGHFILANRCRFRRNTLIQCGDRGVVVSTVGNMENRDGTKIEEIGAFGRYYESMAFEAMKVGEYTEIDVSKQIEFDSEWQIRAESCDQLPDGVDNLANEMHDRVVSELAGKIAMEQAA